MSQIPRPRLAAFPHHRHSARRRDDWRTPKALLNQLEGIYGKLWDACPPKPQFDGLTIPWHKCNYVNCPYCNKVAWLIKALSERDLGKLVVMLLPVDTSTQWWHGYVMRAHEIRFLHKGLKCKDASVAAPFASCVVVLRPGPRATSAPVFDNMNGKPRAK